MTDTTTAGSGKRYDAFISYSHAADGELAPALQRGLQRLAKPWRQRRALEVFRDETGLAVDPDLWDAIERALDASDWFVVLASPAAASSKWVGLEIERAARTKGADRIAVVVTDGTVAWDEAAGDFTADSDAVHPSMRGLFAAEPRIVDLTWARSATDLTTANPTFARTVAELAAPMHGTTTDEVIDTDARHRRRKARIVRGAVVTLLVLAAASAVASVVAVANQQVALAEQAAAEVEAERAEAEAAVAEEERRRAEEQAALATSRELAALSREQTALRRESTVDGDDVPDTALAPLLAVRAWRTAQTDEAAAALLSAVAGAADLGVTPGDPLLPDGLTAQLPLSTDSAGARMVTRDEEGPGVVDLADGTHRRLPGEAPAFLTPDGELLLSADGTAIKVDSGEVVHDGLPPVGSAPAFDPQGRWAAWVEAGTDDRVATLVDLETGDSRNYLAPQSLCRYPCSPGLAVLPDGEGMMAAETSSDEATSVVRIAASQGALIETRRLHLDQGGPLLLVDDGVVQVGDGPQMARLDTATLEEVEPALAGGHAGTWRAHPADGAWLVTGDDSRCAPVRLVDPSSFAILAEVEAARDSFESGCDPVDAVWIEQGRALALQAVDRCGDLDAACVTRLPTDPDLLMAQACGLAGRDLSDEEWATYLPGADIEPTCDGGAAPAPSPDEADGEPDPPRADRPNPPPADEPEPARPDETPADTPADDPAGDDPADATVTLAADGITGGPSLGTPFEEAVAALADRLGPPNDDTGFIDDECSGARLRTVVFADGGLAIQALDAAAPTLDGLLVRSDQFPTAAGLRVGDPGARVLELHPDAEAIEGADLAGSSTAWILAPGTETEGLFVLGDADAIGGLVGGRYSLC